MRRRVAALVAALVAAAVLLGCSGGDLTGGQTLPFTEAPSGVGEGEGTTIAEAAEGTTPPPSTMPIEVSGVVTATGVPVAVLEDTPRGYLVRTPCGEQEILARGSPLGPIEVVIDPGHGGEVDTGAVGFNGLRESELNLELSRRVAARLTDTGVRTVLTRTGDYATGLSVRAELADHLGAELLVSIHHNAPTPGPSPRPGTEVYVQSGTGDSRRLGGLLWEELVDTLSRFPVEWAAAPDAGVLEVVNSRGNDAYGMVRGPETVAALVEVGYLSHRPEAELFATSEYLEAASAAISAAITAYLTTDAPGSGFVADPRTFNPQPGISRTVCEDPPLG